MYSLYVSAILMSMIATGAARSVAVKLFYQLGFECPIFVTLMSLFGQSLSLLVYYISIRADQSQRSNSSSIGDGLVVDNDEKQYAAMEQAEQHASWPAGIALQDLEGASQGDGIFSHGSTTGLTKESKRAVQWVHSIPWYLKPVVPAILNLVKFTMRWGSFAYLTASTAVMLISGTELILSVVAARMIRKRLVSRERWEGVIILTVGVVVVGLANVKSSESEEQSTKISDEMIGILLTTGQSFLSVVQDMAEELFMQEADFPATLLLGMEGLLGLMVGGMLYFPMAPLFGEVPSETWNKLTSSNLKMGYAVGLIILFTVTGIFNIMSTGVTSSMTRNVWKNLRTVLVWIIGLVLYYFTTGDRDLGEEWLMPYSFFILAGFFLMLYGILMYYKNT
jgi:drug/metabolite transporter (DMT)-like permease